ncbi:response regulator transcription factor [Eubacterium sp. AB3007]|uniref:response regulator transcription factor n=1 Tax=Eubacterium sp. AB3007 TaxID=1392487 RepID=UPI000481B15D|nr:response regulator transcription factor [Eubacterium sp. AB3007]
MMDKKILIVDDDPNIREVLAVLLGSDSYDVEAAEDGKQAVDRVTGGGHYDLIILDIMMPNMDGVEACARIREHSSVPILFLTAKDQDQDKVEAYTSGGDDFLVKPFSQTELLMKCKSLIRRHTEYDKQEKVASPDEVVVDNLVVDTRTRSARKGDLRINLTDKEFDILRYFIDHKGEVVQNKDLYENVWGESYLPSASNTIMVHVLNLRKKLEDDINKPRIIKTVWGKGYRIE